MKENDDVEIKNEHEKGKILMEKKIYENIKEKFMIFVIGILIGGVITMGSFFVYAKVNSCNNSNQNPKIQDFMRHEMSNEYENSQNETNKRERNSKSNITDENQAFDKSNTDTKQNS